MFHKRKTNPDGTFQNNRLFLRILPSATFEHLEWFGNEHVGKNHINWVGEITQEMQKANIIPSFLSYDNTSLRKLRTQVLSDAGVEDWMIAETIGHKDKKNQNLLYYRKMDHADKLLMAKVLSNPWRYTKKRTIVDEVDGIDTRDKENIHQPNHSRANPIPIPAKLKLAPSFAPPSWPAAAHSDQQPFVLNNCSHIVFNLYPQK